jgi:hypothetical protein
METATVNNQTKFATANSGLKFRKTKFDFSKHYWDDKKMRWRRKPGKFRLFLKSLVPNWLRYLIIELKYSWDRFWYNYSDNGIFGPGFESYKSFNRSSLALVIAVLTFIIVISYLIFHG